MTESCKKKKIDKETCFPSSRRFDERFKLTKSIVGTDNRSYDWIGMKEEEAEARPKLHTMKCLIASGCCIANSALSSRLISLAVATVVAGCGAPIAANDAADVTVCQQ
jgi:hypothetical protein